MPKMGEYRDTETGERWLIGAGWQISLTQGRAVRDDHSRRGLSFRSSYREVSELEIEACELGLTTAERSVYIRLTEEGKTILRAGWPDLLVIDEDTIYAVEVKSRTDKVSARQTAMHDALRKAGLRVEVVREP